MRRNPRRAFTLLEVLVVIGIIAVLVSILAPTMMRVRENSKRTACLNNLRGLGTAFLLYVSNNDNTFPRPSVNPLPEDWVYWQSGRNRAQGRIVAYLRDSGALDEAAFICPSDNVQSHVPTALGAYPYSYTVNESVCGALELGHAPRRLRDIQSAPTKILILDESSQTVDDGCWAPQNYAGDQHNLLSNRHDREAEKSSDPNAGNGNVLFCDGHSDFVPRTFSLDPKHYDVTLPF